MALKEVAYHCPQKVINTITNNEAIGLPLKQVLIDGVKSQIQRISKIQDMKDKLG